RGHVISESAPHGQELRQRLQGEQERSVGAARRLQDLGKVGISKGSKLVEDDADHRPVLAAALLLVLVTLANHQLHVLQQHPAKGRDRFRVLIGIQRNEQNQFLVNDFVKRQHLIVGASDDGEFVLEKSHQLVQ